VFKKKNKSPTGANSSVRRLNVIPQWNPEAGSFKLGRNAEVCSFQAGPRLPSSASRNMGKLFTTPTAQTGNSKITPAFISPQPAPAIVPNSHRARKKLNFTHDDLDDQSKKKRGHQDSSHILHSGIESSNMDNLSQRYVDERLSRLAHSWSLNVQIQPSKHQTASEFESTAAYPRSHPERCLSKC
jgi:hypothetical protein